jgi:hypothetical protein
VWLLEQVVLAVVVMAVETQGGVKHQPLEQPTEVVVAAAAAQTLMPMRFQGVVAQELSSLVTLELNVPQAAQ